MFRKTKIVLALTLVIILCAGILAPVALATPTPSPGPYTEAAITKVLKVPVGTIVPTGDFRFTVTPVSVNGDTGNIPPTIGSGTISISFPGSGATAAQLGACTCDPACAADVEHYYKESVSLFTGDIWPHAGIYEYSIVEIGNTFGTLPTGEEMNYSQAAYKVRVHVQENPSNGQLFIYTIAAYRIRTDDGGTIGDFKVDPTPGGNNDTYFYSQMDFKNIYTKHTGGIPTDPINRNTLSVTKAVAGDYASTSLYFNYTMTVTKPSLVTDAATQYKFYIVENGVALSTISVDPNGIAQTGSDTGGAYVLVTSGVPFSFKLKAGQSIAFTNTHVGASYSITETGVALYTPSAIVTTAGVPSAAMTALMGNSLSIPLAPVTVLRVGDRPAPGVNTNFNIAAFTNTNEGVIETGLSISDVPFYGLILLAIAGVAVFATVKIRSRKTSK